MSVLLGDFPQSSPWDKEGTHGFVLAMISFSRLKKGMAAACIIHRGTSCLFGNIDRHCIGGICDFPIKTSEFMAVNVAEFYSLEIGAKRHNGELEMPGRCGLLRSELIP